MISQESPISFHVSTTPISVSIPASSCSAVSRAARAVRASISEIRE